MAIGLMKQDTLSMKRKPLQGISFVQVLGAVARLGDDEFEILRSAIFSPAAFDAEKERVEPLAVRMGIDSDTAQTLIEALYFLYKEVYDKSVEQALPSLMVDGLLSAFRSSDTYDQYIGETLDKKLRERLTCILERNDYVGKFEKTQSLIAGLISNAKSFRSIVDLRPLMSEDRQSVLELIPIIQFKIAIENPDSSEKSMVFQMDARRLTALREAVEAAIHKLDIISKASPVPSVAKER